MKIVTKYLVKEIVPNFLVGLAFFTAIMLIQEIFKLVQMSIEKHVPISNTLELFIYVVPYTLALTIPVGVLIGTLLAIGRLSSDIEIIAMRTCGVSIGRILIPTNIFGFIMTILAILFFQWVLPWGNSNYVKTKHRIMQLDPTVELSNNSSLRVMNKYYIEVGEVDDDTKELLRVRVMDNNKDEVIFSPKGKFLPKNLERDAFPLVLSDAIIQTGRYKMEKKHHRQPKQKEEEKRFHDRYSQKFVIYIPDKKVHEINVWSNRIASIDELYDKIVKDRRNESKNNLKNINLIAQLNYKLTIEKQKRKNKDNSKKVSTSIDESYYDAMLPGSSKEFRLANKPKKLSIKPKTANKVVPIEEQKLLNRMKPIEGRIDEYMNSKMPSWMREDLYEFNKKFSIPFACFVFTLIGAPLGIFSKRSGKTLGLGVSAIIIICWFTMMAFSNLFWKRELVSPMIASWIPDIILGLAGVFFIYKRLTR